MRVFFTFCALWLGYYVPLSAGTDKLKIVCYFGSWAVYRPGNGAITVSDLDPTLCDYMIYAFVGLTVEGKVNILDPLNDLSDGEGNGNFEKFNNLRNRSLKTKTMVSMGGWNEGSERYSDVMGNSTLRSTLVKSIVEFLKMYFFDGFDCNWEYPNQRGGVEADKKNFVLFLKELREYFDQHGFILSVAVAAAESSASQSYDISNIVKYVHFVNLMTYDFHGPWDLTLGHNTPLYPAPRETASERSLNVDAAVHYWLEQGAPAKKLFMGMAAYGRTFTLASSSETEPGSPSNGSGKAGPYTQEAGVLSYLEICELQAEGNWTIVWDKAQHVPYTYKGNQWITYDNVRSIIEKAEYVKHMGLGGGMLWSIESEDFRGLCGPRYPLLTAMNRIFRKLSGDP